MPSLWSNSNLNNNNFPIQSPTLSPGWLAGTTGAGGPNQAPAWANQRDQAPEPGPQRPEGRRLVVCVRARLWLCQCNSGRGVCLWLLAAGSAPARARALADGRRKRGPDAQAHARAHAQAKPNGCTSTTNAQTYRRTNKPANGTRHSASRLRGRFKNGDDPKC